MFSFLKQLFCKHRYVVMKKVYEFCNLGGELVVTICEKCGKVKKETFYTNEEFALRYKSGGTP